VYKKINIGFTSIGRRVELIRAFKSAYSALDLDGAIVGIDMDSLAPAFRIADRQYIVPPFHSPEYIPTLLKICKKESIHALFPLIDPDIPLLAMNKTLFAETGTRVVAVPFEAAELCSDKYKTTIFFRDLGLNVPWTLLPEELSGANLSFPVFIKPRAGSASQNTFRAQNSEELSLMLRTVPDPLIQECLPGPEITTDVIADLDGHLLGVVSRQRLEVRTGEVSKGVTVFHQKILDGCVKIAEQLPAVGAITVQCLMKDGIPYFTEVNARFGGGAPLGIAAGIDSPRWLLARMAGLPIALPALGQYQKGLYMTRCDESFFLTESEREKISGRYL
jgi:carbamoyl-phosphate synthase large subunit